MHAYRAFITSEAPETLRTAVTQAAEVGASTWLAALPVAEHGFRLTREQWQDVVAMRYGLPIEDLPERCGCGAAFSVPHALQCALGGFVHGRHNGLRDFFVTILATLFPDVRTEPTLTELSEDQ